MGRGGEQATPFWTDLSFTFTFSIKNKSIISTFPKYLTILLIQQSVVVVVRKGQKTKLT